jgi:hypothetical protein
MENRDGRNPGWNQLVRLLGDYWAVGTRSLRFAARLALAVVLGGLFWLFLVALSAYDWVMG